MTDILLLTASDGENLTLARRFAAAAADRGLSTELIDLTSLELPLFTPRSRQAGLPPALEPLAAQLAASPRWLICTPEYNGSIPPVLSNTIAWLSVRGDDFRALFNGRPIAIATHSGGAGHTVLVALRLQLAHLGASVLGRQLLSNTANPAREESINDLLSRLQLLPAPAI